jgi:hypothetical protein
MTMKTPLRLVAALLPFGIAALSAGCAARLQDPERFDEGTSAADASVRADAGVANECPDVPQLLVTACGVTAGCHTSTDKEQGLDLQSPDPASRLIGASSTEGTGLLVDPSNPAKSVLYTKLGTMPPFGSRMPFGRPALDKTTLACVLDWVTSIAAEDGGTGDAGTTSDDAPAF